MYALLVSHALSIEHEKSVSLPLSQWLKVAKMSHFKMQRNELHTHFSVLSQWLKIAKNISPTRNYAFFDMRHF